MSHAKFLAGLTATVAAALTVWGCETQRQPGRFSMKNLVWTLLPLLALFALVAQPQQSKSSGKDLVWAYPVPDKNPPASHEYETFGAHVMSSGQTDANGVCLADKGALEWVDHRPEMEINGHPLNLHATAITFAERATDTDCSDGAAHWGGKLRVQNTGQQDLDFEVWDCDNGEPGVGHDGFAIRVPAIGYEVMCPDPDLPPAEPSCTLTGGNRQFHPTH